MLNVGFMKKYISSGIWKGVAIQYQLITKQFNSKIVPLAPLPNHFSPKYRRYGLLLVSFIEPVAFGQMQNKKITRF